MKQYLKPVLPKSTSWLWNVVMGILVVYFAQGVFYESGGMMSQLLLLLLLGIGGYCIAMTYINDRGIPRFFYWTTAFWVMMAVTWVVSPKQVYATVMHTTLDTFQQFKAVTVFCFAPFIGYYIGTRKYIPMIQWIYLMACILGIAIMVFIKSALAKVGMANVNETNNAAYGFLYVLPFSALLMGKYKKIAVVSLVVVLTFIMTGAKRGAILCLAIMVLYGLWWYTKNFRLKPSVVIGLVMVLVAGCIYAEYQYEKNDYLQKRIEQTQQGNSSGRDKLYTKIWNKWANDKNPLTMVFGHGTAQSVTVAGNYAHNDWLELLMNNGVFGIFIYAMMFYSAFKFIHRNRKNRFYVFSMMLIMLYWLTKTFFSMGYMSMMACLNMMLLGHEMGNIELSKKLGRRLRVWERIQQRKEIRSAIHPERVDDDEEEYELSQATQTPNGF